MTIGGEVPTQAFAITRLLLALPIMMLNNTSQMSPAASCDQMTAEAPPDTSGFNILACVSFNATSGQWVSSAPLYGIQQIGAPCASTGSGEAAQSPDGLRGRSSAARMPRTTAAAEYLLPRRRI